jgi:hypothetical protein
LAAPVALITSGITGSGLLYYFNLVQVFAETEAPVRVGAQQSCSLASGGFAGR